MKGVIAPPVFCMAAKQKYVIMVPHGWLWDISLNSCAINHGWMSPLPYLTKEEVLLFSPVLLSAQLTLEQVILLFTLSLFRAGP